jgi:hypothetical protein
MIKLLILIGAAVALAFWWRRRQSSSAPPPVDEAYTCSTCNETDCTCEKKSEDETGSQP